MKKSNSRSTLLIFVHFGFGFFTQYSLPVLTTSIKLCKTQEEAVMKLQSL